MRNVFLLGLMILISFGSMAQSKKVLIYTKNGQGYVHDNISASVEALKLICKELKLDFEVSDQPSVFTREKLSKYSLLIFTNTNNETFDTDSQRNEFQNYMQKGGKFIGIHSTCGSERKWEWFWSMLGGKFVRHPVLQPFDIKIIDSNNISTKHLPAIWNWEDECYFMDNLNPDMHVLLAVDLRSIVDDKKTEYPGTVFGKYFPLAWCHEFDGGRQWYTALGHKIEHYQDKNFIQHLKGGILWILQEKN